VEQALGAGEALRISLVDLVVRSMGPGTTETGRAMARTWLRNASEFVFARPDRWLVECILNGADASQTDGQSIGMFGMGFLSTLSQLPEAGTMGGSIELCTRSKEGGLRIRIDGSRADPQVTFAPLGDDEPPKHLGTLVRVSAPPQSPFSSQQLSDLEDETAHLQFFKRARVLASRDGKASTQVNPEASGPEVRVRLAARAIEIEDFGSGITRDVACNALLVPSASTKTRTARGADDRLEAPQVVRRTGLERSTFVVCVGGVPFIDLELPRAVSLPESSELAHLRLEMPEWSKFTLDRGELVFDDGGSREETHLKRVIDDVVHQTFTGKGRGARDTRRLTLLYRGLLALEQRSESHRLASGVFSRHLKDAVARALAQDPDLVPIEAEGSEGLERALAALGAPGSRLVPIDPELVDYDFGRLDRTLESAARASVGRLSAGRLREVAGQCQRGGCLDGTSVVFVDDAVLPQSAKGRGVPSGLGTRNVLFAPRSLLDETASSSDSAIEATSQLAQRLIYRTLGAPGAHVPARPVGERTPHRDADRSLLSNVMVSNGDPKELKGRFSRYSPLWNKLAPTPDSIAALWREQPLLEGVSRDVLLAFWSEYREANDRSAPSAKGPTSTQFTHVNRTFSRSPEELCHSTDLVGLVSSAGFAPETKRRYRAEGHTDCFWLGERSEQVFRIDHADVVKLSDELAQQYGGRWSELSYEERGRIAAEALAERLGELAKPVDPVHLVNHLFVHLLAEHGLVPAGPLFGSLLRHGPSEVEDRVPEGTDGDSLRRELVVRPGRFLAFGEERLWPLPEPGPNLEHLRRLYGLLLIKHAEDSHEAVENHQDLILPGAAKDGALAQLVASDVVVPHLSGTELEMGVVPELVTAMGELGFAARAQRFLEHHSRHDRRDPHLIRRVAESLQGIVVAQRSSRLSAGAKEDLDRLRHAITYLLGRQLDFSHEDVQRTYGSDSGPGFDFFSPGDPVTHVSTVLVALGEKPEVLQKLIRLQVDELGYRADPQLRRGDLLRGTLVVPHLGHSAVVGQLGKLLEKETPLELVEGIVDLASNHQELALMAHLVEASAYEPGRGRRHESENLYASPEGDTQTRTVAAARVFLKNMVLDRLEPSYVREWFESFRRSGKAVWDQTHGDPNGALPAELRAFVASAQKGELPFAVREDVSLGAANKALEAAPWVTVKQLVRAHATDARLEERLGAGDLLGAVERIGSQDPELELGKIGQDVEHGSERDAVQSVLIEGVQNALDALRSFEHQKKAGAEELTATLRARPKAAVDTHAPSPAARESDTPSGATFAREKPLSAVPSRSNPFLRTSVDPSTRASNLSWEVGWEREEIRPWPRSAGAEEYRAEPLWTYDAPTMSGVKPAARPPPLSVASDPAIAAKPTASARPNHAGQASRGVEVSVELEAPDGLNQDAAASPVLTISDPVGMADLSVLLRDFLIPDFTQKDPTGLHAGMLGNGAFQMYQDAEVVRVTTRLLEDPSRVVVAELRPVRDPETGQVVDLRFRVADAPKVLAEEPEFFGTRLQVVQRRRPWGEALQTCIFARFVTREVIGTACATGARGEILPVTLRDKDGEAVRVNAAGNLSKVAIAERPFSEAGSMTALPLTGNVTPSRLTTAGIPFARLSQALAPLDLIPPNLLSLAATGLSVDLPKGAYEPVQSRTKVRLSETAREPLRRTLLDAIYAQAVDEAKPPVTGGALPASRQPNGGPRTARAMFQHAGSWASFEQVRVRRDEKFEDELLRATRDRESISASTFFTQYEPGFLQGSTTPSFAAWIEEGYRTLVPALDQRTARLASEVMRWRAKIEERRAKGELAEGDEGALVLRHELIKMREEATADLQRLFEEWRTETRRDSSLKRRFQRGVDDLEPAQVRKVENFFSNIVAPWFEEKLKFLPIVIPDPSLLPDAFWEVRTEADRRQVAQAFETLGDLDPETALSLPDEKQATLLSELLKSPKVQELREVVELIQEGLGEYASIVLQDSGASRSDVNFRLERTLDGKRASFQSVTRMMKLGLPTANSLPELLELFERCAKGELVTDCAAAKELLVPSLKSAGIIHHEIKHARDEDGGCSDFHSWRRTPTGAMVDFETAAIADARAAAEDLAFEEWVQRTQQRVNENGGAERLARARSLLNELSAIDRHRTYETLLGVGLIAEA
jgi:hypothetical protein